MGFDGLKQEVEDGAALLGAGCDDGPNAFGPSPALFASRALGDEAIDDHEADGRFRKVVRRLHAGGGDEWEVGVPVLAKPVGKILDFPRGGSVDQGRGQHRLTRVGQGGGQRRFAHLLAPMKDVNPAGFV